MVEHAAATAAQSFELIADDGVALRARRWSVESSGWAAVGLVHGMGVHCGRYDALAQSLCRAGCHVMSFDHRGHGETAGKRGYVPRFSLLLDDVGALVEQIKKDHSGLPVYLYGHSLGGLITLLYGLERPAEVRGLIAASPLILPTHAPPAWKLVLGRLLYRLWPSCTLDSGIDRRFISSEDRVCEDYERDPLIHRRISARLGVDMLTEGRRLLQNARQLKVPTLIVHGRGDQLTSAAASQQFAQDCATAECMLVASDYHELHSEPIHDQIMQRLVAWMHMVNEGGSPDSPSASS